MAKKFGKFLFFTAALGTAAAAAYYFIQKKENEDSFDLDDEDFDDFNDDSEKDSDAGRNYVSLTPSITHTDTEESGEAAEDASGEDVEDAPGEEAEDASARDAEPEADAEDTEKPDIFSHLAKQAAAQEKAAEAVEEFFDEEDATEEGSLIKDEDN